MKKSTSLLEIFWTFLKINTFTFGGGFTIIAMIRDEFVTKKQSIDDEEMLDLASLAQSGPGAMAISTSLLTGYKLRGPIGGFVAMFASILPCLVIISIVSVYYSKFRSNFYISNALVGISGVISAVLLVTVFQLGKVSLEKNPIFSALLMIFSFLAGYFTHLNTGFIVLILGILGIVSHSLHKEKTE